MININKTKFHFILKGAEALTLLVLLVLSTVYACSVIYKHKLEETRSVYQATINVLERENEFCKKDIEVYKSLVEKAEIDSQTYEVQYKQVSEELNTLKEQIVISKENEARASRGDIATMELTEYAILTVDEMNEWIAKTAPSNSPFIGNGRLFLEASAASGLSPKYLLAHAALESTWGTSPRAVNKNNYFGITAYNHDPYNSAKSFNSMEEGIIEGAMWIKRHFTDKGRTSLHDMLYEGSAYAQNDDGTPNTEWLNQISSIITNR